MVYERFLRHAKCVYSDSLALAFGSREHFHFSSIVLVVHTFKAKCVACLFIAIQWQLMYIHVFQLARFPPCMNLTGSVGMGEIGLVTSCICFKHQFKHDRFPNLVYRDCKLVLQCIHAILLVFSFFLWICWTRSRLNDLFRNCTESAQFKEFFFKSWLSYWHWFYLKSHTFLLYNRHNCHMTTWWM